MSEPSQEEFVEQLLSWAAGAGDTMSIVLIGSKARQQQWLHSDTDILVVGNEDAPRPPVGVQVKRLTRSEVEARALQGDDFVQWALRMGTPLWGSRAWEDLRAALMPRMPWPDPAVNVKRAHDRLRDAMALYEMGDLEAAQEEAVYALSHLARAELLARHVFPASRPELAAQLVRVGDLDLSSSLGKAIAQDLDGRTIRQILAEARRKLAALSVAPQAS